jgi:peptidoglycan/xylan/chitin deacetylase (PgdA/CDA1 family)
MIFLSFDIEEFDAPAEYGKPLPFEEQISISAKGTEALLDVLANRQIPATFFCTACFAQQRPALIRRMAHEGHEVASHGFYHSEFAAEHLRTSREALEAITGKTVRGFRMARMLPVAEEEIGAAGYRYNSSLNPTFMPGRYNHFRAPRTPFVRNGLWQLPASVTPFLRIPLFWLAMHNLPMGFYQMLCRYVAKRDHYLNIYFHPWEFTDLHNEKFGLPRYISRQSGQPLLLRLEQLISKLKQQGFRFGCLGDLTLGG